MIKRYGLMVCLLASSRLYSMESEEDLLNQLVFGPKNEIINRAGKHEEPFGSCHGSSMLTPAVITKTISFSTDATNSTWISNVHAHLAALKGCNVQFTEACKKVPALGAALSKLDYAILELYAQLNCLQKE